MEKIKRENYPTLEQAIASGTLFAHEYVALSEQGRAQVQKRKAGKLAEIEGMTLEGCVRYLDEQRMAIEDGMSEGNWKEAEDMALERVAFMLALKEYFS